MTERRNKLEKLKTKELYIANELSWTWLEEVRLVEAMNPYLKKVFVNEAMRVTCTACRRLFQIQELVYRELSLEF